MYALILDFAETIESEEEFICIQVDTKQEPLMHYMQQQVFADFNGYEIDPDIMWFPELEDDAEVQDVYFLYKLFIVEI